MKRKEMLRTMFILISLLLFSLLHSDTIIDTLYSIPELDGGISYNWNSNTYYPNTGDTFFYCGDYAFTSFGWGRGFLSYELPEIPTDYELHSAEIFVLQYESIGNDEGDVFPIWNTIPPPDTTGCVVDHIDYGDWLDLDDWTAGDPGDTQTLHTNIGVISDNATYEHKHLDVIDYVNEDYTSGRNKTQYRLRFLINNDWDNYGDVLQFASGNAYLYECPYIVYTWWDGVKAENEELGIKNYELNAYPNPFNSSLTISYNLSFVETNNTRVDIYNIKGQKIYSQTNLQNYGSLEWICYEQRSGIYLIKLSNSKQEYLKKITYLK